MENIHQNNFVQSIVEDYPICISERDNGRYDILENKAYNTKVIDKLQNQNWLFIFYDSTGKAIYTGITEAGNLWNSINNIYNQQNNQKIPYVNHPTTNRDLIRNRMINLQNPYLYDIAYYFSAYNIANTDITKMRALVTRCFANDLLNQIYNF